MQTGTYISGIGHLGLIAWALFGGAFTSAPAPFEVTEVSVISTDEFEAMMAVQRAPQTSPAPTALPQPDAPAESAPPVSAPDATPVPAARPEPAAPQTPAADSAPDVATLVAPPEAEVSDTPPQIAPPQDIAVEVPDVSPRPQQRPVDRVAPVPVAAPPPDARPDDVAQEAAVPEEGAGTPADPQEATAPEEAATEIVTEADRPARAPDASMRPRTRPERVAAPTRVEPEQPAAPNVEQPAPAGVESAVENALAEALGAPDPVDVAPVPSGPPLSAGEKDALRVAVSSCWNVGSLSSEALRTTVVVEVRMTQEARPETGSIRMASFSGGSEAAARQAFEAARRAIIRCGSSGFDLPFEKYAQWREIEMTFNPENMRIR